MGDWFEEQAPESAGGDWFAQQAPDTSGRSPTVISAAGQPVAQRGLEMARSATRMLPYAGGMAAAAFAPATGGMSLPAALALMGGYSALGGMAGEGAEQLINERLLGEEPRSASQSLSEIGRSGVEQGVLGAGGHLLGAPFRFAGRAMMKRAAKTAADQEAKMVQRALVPTVRQIDDYPGVIEAVKRQGIEPTRAGISEAGARLGQSGAETRALYAQVDQTGWKTNLAQLAKPHLERRSKELGRKLTDKERLETITALRGTINDLLGSRAYGFPRSSNTTFGAQELKDIVQSAQTRSKQLIRARNRGENVKVNPDMVLDLSVKGRELLNSIPGFGKKIAEAEARSAEMIAVKNALRVATARLARARAMPAEESGVVSGLLRRLLLSKAVGPQLSHLVNPMLPDVTTARVAPTLLNPALQRTLRLAPAAGGAAYQLAQSGGRP